MQKGIQYTTILHQPRIKAGLTCNEYVIASTIFNLQNNDITPGWCYAPKEWFAALIGLSKRSVITLIFRLVELGFVQKNETGKLLKTTKKWREEIEEFVLSEESSPSVRVKKVHRPSEESSLQNGEESSLETVKKVHPIIIDNKDSIDNDRNNNNSPNGVFDDENVKDYEREITEKAAQEKFEAAQEKAMLEDEREKAEKEASDLKAKQDAEKEKKLREKKKGPPMQVLHFAKFDNPESALSWWNEWEDYKLDEKKQAYKTEKSKKAAIESLYKMSKGKSELAKEILNTSISNLWAGFFEIKQSISTQRQFVNPKLIDSSKYDQYATT